MVLLVFYCPKYLDCIDVLYFFEIRSFIGFFTSVESQIGVAILVMLK